MSAAVKVCQKDLSLIVAVVAGNPPTITGDDWRCFQRVDVKSAEFQNDLCRRILGTIEIVVIFPSPGHRDYNRNMKPQRMAWEDGNSDM